MSKVTGESVSVKIIPNEQATPAGKLADAEVIFEGEAGPLSGLKLIGFACMGTSRWRAKRDVPRPAVLRERGTPELGAVAAHEWGAQRARSDADVHPRRVCSPRGSLLTVRSSHRQAAGCMPAAWGPSSNIW